MCIYLFREDMSVNHSPWAWTWFDLVGLGILGLVNGLWGLGPKISFETEVQQATEAKQLG